NKVKGHFVLLDSINEIARVVMPDKKNFVDFAKCVGKTIEEDLSRRDFSINAMGCDIQNGTVIDIFDGQKDLQNKILKVFDEKNLTDDPLRVLRAYRFASKYNLTIESKTQEMLQKHSHLLNQNNTAKERIQIEFLKLLEGAKSAEILQMMKDNEFLYEIFAELKEQETIPKNSHHHLDLIDHSIETVRQLEVFINTEPKWVQEHMHKDFILGISRLAFLKLATLLHDIGKPQTWEIEADTGRHRFIRHDEIGADFAKKILKKLKYSNNQTKYISKLIKHHIYPSHLLRSEVTEKAILRMFRRLEDETIDVILLAKADRLSAKGEEITDEIIQKNIQGLELLLEKYKTAKETMKPIEKLLSGEEIMELLEIKEGKDLGKIIKELKEAQLSGDINTKTEALEFVKNVKLY
ncbi:MAG: HD domain-containing protein, partial [Candidatus Gastranaerophilales bacterium]|nr:HD domain-containing protein [Candidatus Gastranaerophilales bacterium]